MPLFGLPEKKKISHTQMFRVLIDCREVCNSRGQKLWNLLGGVRAFRA